ncbi:C39 family peptidase [Bacillus sp. 165]|uniref:C39 family peptidase n=1 Tax=Bacillus sp. 165 TaxID=1529117 RepID=UPI001AD9FBB7|nr:C39 family peptidase [Bacillus sp. 165]MBO9128366.1 C39 family peptidase [Bacillus sp. 165]
MLETLKQHKKKTLVSLPLVAAISYCGFRKWHDRNICTMLQAPHILQNPELPRGCEVTSLAMLLSYMGVQTDKMELANKIDKVPFETDSLNGNMHKGFVGDMYSMSQPGLGVYADPIYKLGLSYLPELINLTGCDTENIYTMIEEGAPVWVIINDTFTTLPVDRFETWYTDEGPLHVTYAQHSVLVTGYTKKYVYINDPLYPEANRQINRTDFEEAWIQMGRQAISYKKCL